MTAIANKTSRKIRYSFGERLFNICNILFILLLVGVTVYPLLYTLFASFSDARELLKHEGVLLSPLQPYTLQGYKMTFANPNILSGFVNTTLMVVSGTAIGVCMTMLGAYVVTRKKFKMRGLMMKAIIVTMFFNGGIIPTFFVVRNVGLYNSFWAMIIPTALNTYDLIILRTFFMSIPDSLEESALLDGANDLEILFHIFLPLSLPAIAVITLYYAVDYWNSWYPALLYIRDRKLYPLQMFLRELLIQNESVDTQSGKQLVSEVYTRELVKYCTVIVSTVPIMILYPFLQKYFVKGVMIGALKG
ncbi:MAG TPA: carbohydrate ABC transporter permease [Candidatus Limiplasma sp.]|nr:carbohydrate ABC transporter permease [Candidatus Limiplasma sp.]